MTSIYDLAWLTESQILKVCELSRSTLRSWVRAGLDLGVDAAFDLRDLVTLVLLAETRGFLSPKEMIEAWSALRSTGEDERIFRVARELEPGGRLDLVIDVKYSSLRVVQDDAGLLEASRLRKPRPVVVLDMAEPVLLAVRYFDTHANRTPRPMTKAPGRPRSAARLRAVPAGGSE